MKSIIKHLSGVALLALALLLAPAYLSGIAGLEYGRAYAGTPTAYANASGPTTGGMGLAPADVPQGGFGQATTRPTDPSQAQASYALGQSCVVVYLSAQTPAAVNAGTTVEQNFTVTGVATGSVIAISKPTTQAGLGIVGVRVQGANTVGVTFINVTGGNITPTAAQNYWVLEFRGPLIQSTGTLTFAACPAQTTTEFIRTIPVAAGQQGISAARVATEPTTYTLAPNINNIDGSIVGSANSSSQSTPTASTLPSLNGAPQCVVLNKPTAQADLGVANVRVVDHNQLGITFSNTAAAAGVTPTPEAYTFIALRGVSLHGDVIYGVNVGTLAAVNTITAPEQTVACVGLAVGDVVLTTQKPTDQAGLGVCIPRSVGTVDVLPLKFVNPTGGNITPTASEIYLVPVQKNRPGEGAVLTQFSTAFTPTAVAADTGAEQTFTVTGLVSGAPLAGFNAALGAGFGSSLGGKLAPGIIIGGVRVSATDTLAVNLINITGASITPGQMQATVLQGQLDSAGAAAAAAGSFVAWPIDAQLQQLQETVNRIQAALVKVGWITGA